MNAQEWGQIPESWGGPMPTKSANRDEWKVIEDERAAFDVDRFCIYAVPPVVKDLGRNAPVRLVAKCARRTDADLIVSLYEGTGA